MSVSDSSTPFHYVSDSVSLSPREQIEANTVQFREFIRNYSNLTPKKINEFTSYILQNFETWVEEAAQSSNQYVYKKASEDSNLLRSVSVEKDGTLCIHLSRRRLGDKLLGKGAFRNFRTAFNLTKGFAFAVGSSREDRVNSQEIEKEIKILSQFSGCEGVVQLLGAREVIGKGAIPKVFVEEHLYDTGALIDLFSKRYSFTNKEKLQITRNMLVGLREIHERGIVHRDIKPDNILLDAEGVAYIADFGFACLEDDLASLKNACGTAHYVSPEYALGISLKRINEYAVGKPNDIWAMGCVLYSLNNGKSTPWHDQNPVLQINKIKGLLYGNALLSSIKNPCGTIDENPLGHLISEMLHPERDKRITAQAACDKYLGIISDKLAEIEEVCEI